MAKARNNATDLMSGRVDQFVFRDWFGQTVVAKRPKQSRKEPSEHQLAVRRNFKLAARYAKMASDNGTLRAMYAPKLKPGRTVYMLAMSDYYDAPEIVGINTDDYSGSIGSKIVIDVFDEYKVTAVKVKITRADGTLVEQGNAAEKPGTVLWEYSSTVNNASLNGCIVTVTAYDLPGNSTVEHKNL